MVSKTIFFRHGSVDDQVEFEESISPLAIRQLFLDATESHPSSILKLRKGNGSLVAIEPLMEANDESTRYSVEVVASPVIGEVSVEGKQKLSKILEKYDFIGSNIEKRLDELETRLKSLDKLGQNEEMQKAIQALSSLKAKVEEAEYLNWIGLSKNPNVDLDPIKIRSQNNTDDVCREMYISYKKMDGSFVNENIKDYLKTANFDNWKFRDEEMMYLLQHMFESLGLIEEFSIDSNTLHNFVIAVHANYNNNPFHNFRHCFCVTQMMYGLIWMCELQSKMDKLDLLALIVSAMCHDLDHPGLNNAYQVNAHTELAIRYNDVSPLENHHCSVAFRILDDEKSNIFATLSKEDYIRLRKVIISNILATDMARHGEILGRYKESIEGFDFTNVDHKALLMNVLLKASDISNEVRPMDVSEPWVDCLLAEFFAQSDKEKLQGLPVAPFMDRDKVTKPTAQIGFIGFVLFPLFESLAAQFPQLTDKVVSKLKDSHQFYINLQKKGKEDEAASTRSSSPDVEGVGHVHKDLNKGDSVQGDLCPQSSADIDESKRTQPAGNDEERPMLEEDEIPPEESAVKEEESAPAQEEESAKEEAPAASDSQEPEESAAA
eukprot:Nk52_evm16s1360 gene=Nk52_evmTU16s1360